MKFMKDFFMIIGLLITLLITYGVSQVDNIGDLVSKIKKFDPKAQGVYTNMATVLINTGDIAKATIKKVQISDDISNEEVVESLGAMALEMDIMIHGGVQLPPKLMKLALSVKKTIYTMMDKSAIGKF